MKKAILGITAVIAVVVLAGCSSGKLDETPQTLDNDTIVQPTYEPEPEPEATEPATNNLGDTVHIDNWDVKIDEAVLDANAAIEGANEFNDAPAGQYVLVTMTGTNTGTEIDDLAWMTARFLGSDKKVYDESFAVTPFDNSGDTSEAAPGGTVSAQFTFDVPLSALGSGASVIFGYNNEQFILVQ